MNIHEAVSQLITYSFDRIIIDRIIVDRVIRWVDPGGRAARARGPIPPFTALVYIALLNVGGVLMPGLPTLQNTNCEAATSRTEKSERNLDHYRWFFQQISGD